MIRTEDYGLINSEVAILGFAYARSFTETPEFWVGDIMSAQDTTPNLAQRLSSSTVSRGIGSLSTRGCLQIRWSSPTVASRIKPRLYAQATEQAETVLVAEVLKRFNHKRLLIFPDTTQALAEHVQLGQMLLDSSPAGLEKPE